jgi:hypothetical protein
MQVISEVDLEEAVVILMAMVLDLVEPMAVDLDQTVVEVRNI